MVQSRKTVTRTAGTYPRSIIWNKRGKRTFFPSFRPFNMKFKVEKYPESAR